MSLAKYIAVAFVLSASLFVTSQAAAHVFITSPAQGAEVQAGSMLTVEWMISVNHGPPDVYDLMLSVDGGEAFEVLVDGLGSDTTAYVWRVPSQPAPAAELLIVQHGANGYRFMHAVYFEIVAELGPADPAPDADAGPVSDADMGVDRDSGNDGSGPEMRGRPDAVTALDLGVELPPQTAEAVLGLFEQRCALEACHSGPTPQAGLDFDRSAFPDNLLDVRSSTGLDGTFRIRSCEPDDSELLARVRGQRGLTMPPPPEKPLSTETVRQLALWIQDGAPSSGPILGDVDACRARIAAGDGGCTVTGTTRTDAPAGTTAWILLMLVGVRAASAKRQRGQDQA